MQVQEEPELDIVMPQVFTQPELTTLQRGKLPQVELAAAKLYRAHLAQEGTGALGPDYQALVNEFQPLFAWAIACWDYLLSTEGCRFVSRNGEEKLYARGDYRAVTDRDFSRMVHRIFRACVFAFAQQPPGPSLSTYVRAHFWAAVVQTYQQLDEPADPRQRRLTAYSYLRCVPYQFLNAYHHDLVYTTLQRLPYPEYQALDLYFLNFLTFETAAQTMGLSPEVAEEILRRGLLTLLRDERLVYCLLRQIERY